MKKSVFSDKIFGIAFAVSVISHIFLFVKGPDLSFISDNKPIEITYVEPEIAPRSIIEDKEVILKKTKREEKESRLEVAKKHPGEEQKLKAEGKEFVKREESKSIVEQIKNIKIDEEALYQLPEFSDYYQYLRERIRQTIFRPRPFKPGEVVIKFTLLRDGTLKEIAIIDKLSASNAYLRYAAVKAVKDAAPFKSFPEELRDIKEMPFQVSISFELTK